MSRIASTGPTATGLLAAALFGASAPLAKLLLPGTGPLLLAGLLYLGAAVGVTVLGLVESGRAGSSGEARLRRADVGLVTGIVASGGLVAPVAMLAGLERVSAVIGSLLLNLEAPLTILLAVALWGDHMGRRAMAATSLIVAGAVSLTSLPGDVRADPIGVIALLLACLAWAIDNNLTQQLSLRDPVAIVRVKGFSAGIVNLALGIGTSARMPSPPQAAAGMAVGFVCYGLSLVLAVRAMRALGAARQSALFASAPFMGAVVAVVLLGERFGLREMVSGAAMVGGVGLLITERHDHRHVHERLEHEHLHVHDEHHQHRHGPDDPLGEPHTHAHTHLPSCHAHPHVPDAHHRHRH